YEPIVAAADNDGVEASGRGRHSIVPFTATSPYSRTMADRGKDQTQRSIALLLVAHACGDCRKSAIDIGNFAGDGAGQVGKQKRGHVADLVDGHIAPQWCGLFDKMQNLGKAGDARRGERLDRPGGNAVDADALGTEALREVTHV